MQALIALQSLEDWIQCVFMSRPFFWALAQTMDQQTPAFVEVIGQPLSIEAL